MSPFIIDFGLLHSLYLCGSLNSPSNQLYLLAGSLINCWVTEDLWYVFILQCLRIVTLVFNNDFAKEKAQDTIHPQSSPSRQIFLKIMKKWKLCFCIITQHFLHPILIRWAWFLVLSFSSYSSACQPSQITHIPSLVKLNLCKSSYSPLFKCNWETSS